MRAILGLLLCFLLLQTQVFASSGGPNYDLLDSSRFVRGIYSGTLRAKRAVPDSGISDPNFIAAMGIFSASFATSQDGTGTYVIFNQGTVNTGTITLVANAPAKKMSGIFEPVVGTLNGFMDLDLSRTGRNINARLSTFKGKATLTSTSPITEIIYFKVSGSHTTA